ncbi:MAG: hypothetical protein HY081_06575 [Gammaproteobacteria bacterium]|nr:hypothetical protein [Gammaproteobacteria bacterium]
MNYLSWIFFPLHRLAVVLFLAIFLAACGSGGGGGSNSNANATGALQPVIYVGNSNGAVITGANAKTLAAFAMSDFGTRYAGQVVSGVDVQTAQVSGKPIFVHIADTLQKSLKSVKLNPVNVNGVSIQDTGTVACVPSGSATVNITVDSAGDFTGSIRYSACNDEGVGALSGNIAIQGHILATGNLESITSAGTFAFTQGAQSNTFTGSLTTQYGYDTSGLPISASITATVDIRNDTANGEYIRFNNFVVKNLFGGTYSDISYDGVMCHWLEGCGLVATPATFRFQDVPDPGPFPGGLEITGALTPLGYSKLRLTGVDKNSYNLEWDTLGTGTYTPPLLQLWSNFRL